MPLDSYSQLNREAALELLEDPDAHALALVAAANRILEGELLDEDEDVHEEEELRLLLHARDAGITEENLVKITGFLMALTTEAFTTRPKDTIRMSSAIVEGDPFLYEDDPDEMGVVDILWAIHQVDLLYEDDLVEELDPRVVRMLDEIPSGYSFDLEEYRESSEDGDPPESALLLMLDFRKRELADQLNRLNVPADWVDSDQRMAEMMAGG